MGWRREEGATVGNILDIVHQQNPAEIAALADKAINYLHYTRL